MKSVYQVLTGKSNVTSFGEYTIQDLAKLRAEDKGGYGIDTNKVVQTTEIEDSKAREIQSDSVSAADNGFWCR